MCQGLPNINMILSFTKTFIRQTMGLRQQTRYVECFTPIRTCYDVLFL